MAIQVLTPAEYRQLREQLARAQENLREAQKDKARAHISAGDPDMHENAAAEEAYENIRKWAGEVERLSRIVNQSKVLTTEPVDDGSVQLGCLVTMRIGEVEVQKIMSGPQGRWDKDQVSSVSKVGKAILGQAKGARVSYETDDGVVEVVIVDIQVPQKSAGPTSQSSQM